MSVIGIDFGNYKTCVAVARNKGIDIVVNDVSNRFTPSMVSFNGKQRFLGEGAKTQEVMGYKNTVTNLKRLIGRDFSEAEIQDYEKQFLFFNLCASENGLTAAKVMYNDEQQVFDSTQLTAMFFTQIKQTTERSLEGSISTSVVSVPAYFTDRQRLALQSALEISNLPCVKLVNEPTAAALAYGITRVSDLPPKDATPRYVLFVDVGHSALTASVAAFTAEKAEILSTAFDRSVGGRILDKVLVDHFVQKIKEKHKSDISDNPKALLRLRVAIEKMKHVLSANAQAPLQIECLTDTLDINFLLKREEFEEMLSHVFERVTPPILTALHESGVKKEDIFSVEIIGGSTRIPAIQKKIVDIFGREEILSKTLNMDESVARGCSLQCAIMSPLFRVREYNIKDVTPYGIKICWDPIAESTNTESLLFKPASAIPGHKAVTFYRSAPFELRAEYANREKLPPGTSPFVGKIMIDGVKPTSEGKLSDVKVRMDVNENGIFEFHSAKIAEEVVVAAEEQTAMETDQPKGEEKKEEKREESGDVKMDEGEKKEEVKKEEVKKKKVYKDLPFVATNSKISPQVLDKYREIEGQMIASDKLIFETQEKKNNLEAYIYEIRGKLEGTHAQFEEEKVKEDFLSKLSEVENWLYDEGEEATKSVFVEKLASLKKIGDPIEMRFREEEERPSAVADLKKAIEQFKSLSSSVDPKYEHIEEADRKKVLDECVKKEEWLNQGLAEQAKTPKTQNPKLIVAQIKANREALVMFCAPIMNKPKPKQEPPKEEAKPTKEQAEHKEVETNHNQEEVPKSEKMQEAEPDTSSNPEKEMDVD